MIHKIKGNNFHGNYYISVRAPSHGGRLSESQARRVKKTLCGVAGCTCGGGYGAGPDSDSAKIEYDFDNEGYFLTLIPAK